MNLDENEKLHSFQESSQDIPQTSGHSIVGFHTSTVMKCSKCGWWTSDFDVSSDHLIKFWVDYGDGPEYVGLNCFEMQVHKIQTG